MSSGHDHREKFESRMDDGQHRSPTLSRERPYDPRWPPPEEVRYKRLKEQRDALATEERKLARELLGIQPTPQLVADIQLASQCHACVLVTSIVYALRLWIAEFIHTRSGRTGPLIVLNVRDVLDDADGVAGSYMRAVAAAESGTLYLDYDERATIALLEHMVTVRAECAHDRDASVAEPRLIVGTGIDLFARMDRGSFPESLYYRLNTIHIVS
jgi:DNA-binding NtrC family response regulator